MSLFDPFFVDYIVLDKDTPHYSTSKFHDIHTIQGRLWSFYVICFYYVEYSGLRECYDQSVFDRVFNVFFQSKVLIYCIFFLKHVTSFWWLILFFTGLFFRLKSVLYKKYTNVTGKDIKYTNAIDII